MQTQNTREVSINIQEIAELANQPSVFRPNETKSLELS